MSHERRTLEFEAHITDNGTITVPPQVLEALGSHARAGLNVRLTSTVLAGELHVNGATEEEVERIASLQLESREQVIGFLLSEGALARRRRSGARKRGRDS